MTTMDHADAAAFDHIEDLLDASSAPTSSPQDTVEPTREEPLGTAASSGTVGGDRIGSYRLAPPTDPPFPTDDLFGSPALPDWVTGFRPAQWETVTAIFEAFKTNDLVFLDAPTGSGKTLVGECVRRLVGQKANYLCSDKSLQAQFMRDFGYAALLMGRRNYIPVGWDEAITCDDCNLTRVELEDGTLESKCSWCPFPPACPYTTAKMRAMASPLSVLNLAYWLSSVNFVEKSPFRRPLTIIDEADTLESTLMSFIEIYLSARTLKQYRIDPAQPRFVTKPESWAEWISQVVRPQLARELRVLPEPDPETPNAKLVRARKKVERLIDSMNMLHNALSGEDPWVFDDYARGNARFKPVSVAPYGRGNLWQHGKKFLLMSATLISADEMVQSLGYKGSYATVTMASTFPLERRPIFVAPVANMTNKEREAEWPKLVYAINQILPHHKTERVLIHAVSYALAAEIAAGINDRPVVTYKTAAEREQALAAYRATPGAVLVSPSMDRGVDLRDDDCRVVIVAKVPFPNLGDKQVNARLHSRGGELWYRTQMVRSLVQMTGRGMRSADDFCISYILDKQFTSNVYRNSRSLLPSWWRDALDFTYPTRTLQRSTTQA